ncbi:hypothetical protein, partial [Pedobacter gandavensis]|uniref:hypothetical protein n=1 Tax=Pedobacter gandavensis TaxID=2679963 RepID=UPI00292E0ED1
NSVSTHTQFLIKEIRGSVREERLLGMVFFSWRKVGVAQPSEILKYIIERGTFMLNQCIINY